MSTSALKWMLAVTISLIIGILVWTSLHPWKCVEESVVKSILSINYRSAKVEFMDGQVRDLSQAILKPGDTYCLKESR